VQKKKLSWGRVTKVMGTPTFQSVSGLILNFDDGNELSARLETKNHLEEGEWRQEKASNFKNKRREIIEDSRRRVLIQKRKKKRAEDNINFIVS